MSQSKLDWEKARDEAAHEHAVMVNGIDIPLIIRNEKEAFIAGADWEHDRMNKELVGLAHDIIEANMKLISLQEKTDKLVHALALLGKDMDPIIHNNGNVRGICRQALAEYRGRYMADKPPEETL